MRRTLTTLLAATILASGGGYAAIAHQGEAPHRHAVIPTRPCPEPTAQGDSVNCFWDAGSRGGKHSFWVTERADGSICLRYLRPKMNRERGGCWFE